MSAAYCTTELQSQESEKCLYFDHANDLYQFQSFYIRPTSDSHAKFLKPNEEIKHWTVFGTLLEKNWSEDRPVSFAIASFTVYRDAITFLSMTSCIIDNLLRIKQEENERNKEIAAGITQAFAKKESFNMGAISNKSLSKVLAYLDYDQKITVT